MGLSCPGVLPMEELPFRVIPSMTERQLDMTKLAPPAPPSLDSTPDSTAPLLSSPSSQSEVGPTGAWVRLACCDHTVHPVALISESAGVLEISPPREPHPDWVQMPDSEAVITMGWSDEEGTLGLYCQVSGETEEGNWALRIVGNNEFPQRRRNLRVPTTASAYLIDEAHIRPVELKLIDISESGMKCEVYDFVPDNRDMPYRFALNLGGPPAFLMAELRWSARINPVLYHAAFEFLSPGSKNVQLLRAHVIQQLARSNQER